MRDIIRYYTREAGVRSLEREISKICRKVVKAAAEEEVRNGKVTSAKNLDKFLGVRKYTTAWPRRRTRSARSPGWRGPRSAATC
jgi:ATP-dependent Lon protease